MEIISMISAWMIPFIILIVLIYATVKKYPAYDLFVEGGKDAFEIVVTIIPFMVGMMVAIAIFQASGLMEVLIKAITPLFNAVGVPTEVAPIALVRPISGHAALGMTNELLKTHGADSLIGKLSSAIHASSDTTFFVLTVYFGSIGMKKVGDSVKLAIIGDIVGIISAIFLIMYFWK